ncbi:MAG: phosphomannomutase/phosphoglucomutase [Gammaproteobacteria bacterium]|nr:phosphomannomutase/phosphoglucomutase [Gammaproteobacteria bacterium]
MDTMNENIFRAYDIRGIYPKDLNEDIAYKIGFALSRKINEPKAVVAIDGRLSGPKIKRSLINGLIDNGVDVIDCGAIPTPMLYFATKTLCIPNGFMITGSHNPKEYNGIKMIVDGNPLFDKDIYELRDWIKHNKMQAHHGKVGTVNICTDISSKYIARIHDDLSINISQKIIIDCMNGVTGNVIKDIVNSFNISSDLINEKVDGNFPNCHPDPTKEENLKTLKEKIKSTDAKYGVAFDGDGDRLVIIRNNGNVIWPDELMILFSKSILSKSTNAKIVFDVKCTRNLRTTIENSGGIAIESRTGHSFIKQTIRKEGAKLGGEMSGHIFFNDKWYGFDDGIYVFLRFLEILSNDHNMVEELMELPKTHVTPEIDIDFPKDNHFKFIEAFKKKSVFTNYTVSDLDGIKISNSESWGLIRASNTSPKITLRFESLSEKGLISIKNEIKNAILEIDNTLELPF